MLASIARYTMIKSVMWVFHRNNVTLAKGHGMLDTHAGLSEDIFGENGDDFQHGDVNSADKDKIKVRKKCTILLVFIHCYIGLQTPILSMQVKVLLKGSRKSRAEN